MAAATIARRQRRATKRPDAKQRAKVSRTGGAANDLASPAATAHFFPFLHVLALHVLVHLVGEPGEGVAHF